MHVVAYCTLYCAGEPEGLKFELQMSPDEGLRPWPLVTVWIPWKSINYLWIVQMT